MKKRDIKTIIYNTILGIVGIINLIAIYFLEHPNKLDIPSMKQMGLYRGLLTYNDYIYSKFISYLVIICIVIIIILIFLLTIRKLSNYIVLSYFVILFMSFIFMKYNNPNIYTAVLITEFILYSIINIFIKLFTKIREK